MASAVYENERATQTVRLASVAPRRRRFRRLDDASAPRCRAPRAAPRSRARGLWRGVGASVAIAGGYVSLMSALRALFTMT